MNEKEFMKKVEEHLNGIFDACEEFIKSVKKPTVINKKKEKAIGALRDLSLTETFMYAVPEEFKEAFGVPRLGRKFITVPLMKDLGGGQTFAILKHKLLMRVRAEYSSRFGRGPGEYGGFRAPIVDVSQFKILKKPLQKR